MINSDSYSFTKAVEDASLTSPNTRTDFYPFSPIPFLPSPLNEPTSQTPLAIDLTSNEVVNLNQGISTKSSLPINVHASRSNKQKVVKPKQKKDAIYFDDFIEVLKRTEPGNTSAKAVQGMLNKRWGVVKSTGIITRFMKAAEFDLSMRAPLTNYIERSDQKNILLRRYQYLSPLANAAKLGDDHFSSKEFSLETDSTITIEEDPIPSAPLVDADLNMDLFNSRRQFRTYADEIYFPYFSPEFITNNGKFVNRFIDFVNVLKDERYTAMDVRNALAQRWGMQAKSVKDVITAFINEASSNGLMKAEITNFIERESNSRIKTRYYSTLNGRNSNQA